MSFRGRGGGFRGAGGFRGGRGGGGFNKGRGGGFDRGRGYLIKMILLLISYTECCFRL